MIQAGAMAKGGEVFLLDMGKPVKIIDLAQTMARMNGLKPFISNLSSDKVVGDIANIEEIKIIGLRPRKKAL